MKKYKNLLNFVCGAVDYLHAVMEDDRKNTAMHFAPKDYDRYLTEITKLNEIRQELLKMTKT